MLYDGWALPVESLLTERAFLYPRISQPRVSGVRGDRAILSTGGNRIDVARIMREIREEARVCQGEIERRIERVRKQVDEQLPELAEERLQAALDRLNEVFDGYHAQMSQFLVEQEPNLENIRHTLLGINRLIADPEPEKGRHDRWWNPWFWVKSGISPLRRYVMRRQYELNGLMRDTLFYLVNHSGHLATQRMALEMGVNFMQVANALLGRGGLLRRYFEEWPKKTLAPILDYLADVMEKQAADFEQLARDYLSSLTEGLGKNSEARLNRVERQIATLSPSKAAGTVGFDNLRLADAARGSEENLRQRQEHYLPHLWGQEKVLDAGCGRGEFLEILREKGVPAYGIDSDEEMVRHCREKGLDVRREDILDHLASLPDESLGGLVAFQLIEHFDFPALFQFFQAAGRKVRPGGVIIVETVNPSCLTVFSGALYADPTHQRPIHCDAARQLLESAGFADVSIELLSPVPDSDRLAVVEGLTSEDPILQKSLETMNRNFDRINSVLYGFADYAAVGKKPKTAQ